MSNFSGAGQRIYNERRGRMRDVSVSDGTQKYPYGHPKGGSFVPKGTAFLNCDYADGCEFDLKASGDFSVEIWNALPGTKYRLYVYNQAAHTVLARFSNKDIDFRLAAEDISVIESQITRERQLPFQMLDPNAIRQAIEEASDFDWNRPIKSLPKIGQTLGAKSLGDGLEKAFFAFVPATVSLSATHRLNEAGATVRPTLSGSVHANDEKEIAKLEVLELNGGELLLDTVARSYRFEAPAAFSNRRYQARIHTGGSGIVKSGVASVEFVQPYLWGMHENPDLSGSALYQAFARQVQGRGNKGVSYRGASKHLYFAYPAAYGALKEIKDPNNFSALGSFRAAVRGVQSVGLARNWRADYRVYVSRNKTTVSSGSFKMNY